MANPEHMGILNAGRDAWNRWRRENPNITPDLVEADLSGQHLRLFNFQGADLREANLSGVYAAHGQFWQAKMEHADLRDGYFSEASFAEAMLSRANGYAANFSSCQFQRATLTHSVFGEARFVRASFTEALLDHADFTEADLSGAEMERTDLRWAVLVGANLNAARLTGADLTHAQLGNTLLVNTNLSSIAGLQEIDHFRKSFIDIDTLVASGELPSSFLQGLGLSDGIIDYLPSLLSRPIQFYSCFISYSGRDEPFAKRLHSDLQAHGVRCWFAPEDMKIGDRIRDRIDASIKVHDKLLLVLSRHSIASQWVEKEVETAFEQERQRDTTVLFPITLDRHVFTTDKAWAADIRRTRHIGDFCRWKDHDAYQVSYQRLLKDLKASGVVVKADAENAAADWDEEIPF